MMVATHISEQVVAMSDLIPEPYITHFTVDLPAEDPSSFDGFTSVVSPMFDLVRVHEAQPFFVNFSTTCLPDIYLTRTVAAASRYERTPATIARTGTDSIVLQVYLSGSFSFEIDGRKEAVGANEIAFFDLRRPVNIQTGRVDNISLAVSRPRRIEE